MKGFHDGDHIRVMSGPLDGMEGIVMRRRRQDDGAWVKMFREDSSPNEHFPFSNDPTDDRANHTLLYPEDCEPV